MATNHHIAPERLEADIRAGTIDTVIVAFCDHQGRLIGKRIGGHHYLDVVAKDGTENCDYLLACDLDDTPIPGFGWASYEQGYGDMRAVVDPATIRYLPWHEATAVVLTDLVDVDTGAPVEVSPRRMLQRQVERAAALGCVPMIGSEVEFYLYRQGYDAAAADGYRTLQPGSPWVQDYSILQTSKEEDVIGPIRRGLSAAGFPVESSKGEAGRGQHEINLAFQTAVESADMNLLFKTAVKEIAHVHGRSATFMAKPSLADAGSSCHIHASLWRRPDDDARGVPDDRVAESLVPDPAGRHHMSDTFRWFLGGVIATARELTLLAAPNVNSYKRFQPGSWAPTGVGWGVDNRTLGFRLVGHGEGMRIESRIPGADANPYHAFAAIIAGGMHGIAERIEPPEPYEGDGYSAIELDRLPVTFPEAIELWRSSDVARGCFGDDVHHHVLHHAESEWRAFNQTVTDWELRRYFERI